MKHTYPTDQEILDAFRITSLICGRENVVEVFKRELSLIVSQREGDLGQPPSAEGLTRWLLKM